jgi:hypothetical protein
MDELIHKQDVIKPEGTNIVLRRISEENQTSGWLAFGPERKYAYLESGNDNRMYRVGLFAHEGEDYAMEKIDSESWTDEVPKEKMREIIGTHSDYKITTVKLCPAKGTVVFLEEELQRAGYEIVEDEVETDFYLRIKRDRENADIIHIDRNVDLRPDSDLDGTQGLVAKGFDKDIRKLLDEIHLDDKPINSLEIYRG